MACALGVAFRPRGDEPVVVGVVERRRRAAGGATTLRAHARYHGARARRRTKIARALQRAEVQVVVEPGTPPVYHLDPTRAESRLARAHRGRPAADGPPVACDVFAARDAPIEAIGSRYIDWLLPGLLGMNIMSTGPLGPRLLDRPGAHAQAAQAPHRLAHAPARLPAGAVVRAPRVPGDRGRRAAALRLLRLRRADARIGVAARWARACSARWPSAGIGLLVASRARTIEAVSGLLNLVMLPDVGAVGGLLFVRRTFPRRCSRSSRRCR